LLITTGGITLGGIGIGLLGIIGNEYLSYLGYFGIPLLIGGIILTSFGTFNIIQGIKNLSGWKEFKVYEWDFTIHLQNLNTSQTLDSQ